MNGFATGDIRQHRILDLTQDLMRLRMTTRERCLIGMELIQEVLGRSGIDARIRSFDGGRARGHRVLEASVGPRNARHTICFEGHLDVVDVQVAEWDWLWTPRIQDHWLDGRGGLDMLAAIACKVDALIEIDADPRDVRVILLLVDDEERPPPHVLEDWWEAEGEGVDFVISGEPTQLKIGYATRGLTRVTFRVTGVGGHSGYGFMLQNPNPWARRLCDLMDKLAITRHVTADYPHGAEVQQTAFSSGSDSTHTSIPPHADVVYTIRTIPGQTLDDFRPEIKTIVNAISEQMVADANARKVKRAVGEPPIGVSYTEPLPAGWISPDDSYVRTLVEAVRPAHRPETKLLVAQGGFGDGAYTRRGSGDKARTVECGLIGEGYHGPERLLISSVVPYTESLVRFHRLLADSTT